MSVNTGYMSGFGNEFASEALEGALPKGCNSPQKAPYGLYAEQLTGAPFTAPRTENKRSWLYRIRPSVMHPPFKPANHKTLRSTPFDEVPANPSQMRWSPFNIPAKGKTDLIEGLITVAGNGDTHSWSGLAVHIYCADTSMSQTKRYFYNADGEMLFVPQQGKLILRTEMGVIETLPGEIAVIPRGVKFAADLPDGPHAAMSAKTTARPSPFPTKAPLVPTVLQTRAIS